MLDKFGDSCESGESPIPSNLPGYTGSPPIDIETTTHDFGGSSNIETDVYYTLKDDLSDNTIITDFPPRPPLSATDKKGRKSRYN